MKIYFHRATRRDLATQREGFTPKEVERLQSLAAYGPLATQPVDRMLALRGWIEQYDDMDAVDLVEFALAAVGHTFGGAA